MNNSIQSPTNVLSEYVVRERYEDIPSEVIELTKACVLDSIGCSVGGLRLEAWQDCGRILRRNWRST